jgi:23S rRNA (cytosine1962-C5)-methyltransferase
LKKVVVKGSSAEKLAAFFPWVYDNEILECPESRGDIVEVFSKSGAFLGTGYLNTHSAISVRILSFGREKIDRDFFVRRISMAFASRRDILGRTNACRIVHSEADGLPGLIADIYNGFLVVQVNTLGMENFRDTILDVFSQVLEIKAVYEKSDARSREKEGLQTRENVLRGEVPERVIIEENGIKFHVELRGSQKTGFYLDQRRNRCITSSRISAGMRVLDVFSHAGAFGIYAALKGAKVKLVDVSRAALDLAQENAGLNGLGRIEAIKADAFDFIDDCVKNGTRADAVVLDPPPFSKTRGSRQGALKGMKHLALQSLRILGEGGLLAIFSCSHNVSMDDLLKLTTEAARDTRSRLEVTDFLFQDLDHPYLINIPQSLYLKGLLLKKHD